MFKCVYLEGVWQTSEREGLFGKRRRTSYVEIDGHDLAQQIEGACNEFARNGFDVVSIVPKANGNTMLGLHAGWAYTAGVVVVARRDDPPSPG